MFHVEFSSILLRNHAALLEKQLWQALNPPGFKYLGNVVDAVKQGKAGLKLSVALHGQGFLTEYACSTLENDFNGFAARLFGGVAHVWAIAGKHPKIRKKLEPTIGFYRKLDGTMDEKFFKGQVKGMALLGSPAARCAHRDATGAPPFLLMSLASRPACVGS